MEPQISQICCRLRACYRTQDCQNILEITVQAQRAKPSTATERPNGRQVKPPSKAASAAVLNLLYLLHLL